MSGPSAGPVCYSATHSCDKVGDTKLSSLCASFPFHPIASALAVNYPGGPGSILLLFVSCFCCVSVFIYSHAFKDQVGELLMVIVRRTDVGDLWVCMLNVHVFRLICWWTSILCVELWCMCVPVDPCLSLSERVCSCVNNPAIQAPSGLPWRSFKNYTNKPLAVISEFAAAAQSRW